MPDLDPDTTIDDLITQMRPATDEQGALPSGEETAPAPTVNDLISHVSGEKPLPPAALPRGFTNISQEGTDVLGGQAFKAQAASDFQGAKMKAHGQVQAEFNGPQSQGVGGDTTPMKERAFADTQKLLGRKQLSYEQVLPYLQDQYHGLEFTPEDAALWQQHSEVERQNAERKTLAWSPKLTYDPDREARQKKLNAFIEAIPTAAGREVAGGMLGASGGLARLAVSPFSEGLSKELGSLNEDVGGAVDVSNEDTKARWLTKALGRVTNALATSVTTGGLATPVMGLEAAQSAGDAADKAGLSGRDKALFQAGSGLLATLVARVAGANTGKVGGAILTREGARRVLGELGHEAALLGINKLGDKVLGKVAGTDTEPVTIENLLHAAGEVITDAALFKSVGVGRGVADEVGREHADYLSEKAIAESAKQNKGKRLVEGMVRDNLQRAGVDPEASPSARITPENVGRVPEADVSKADPNVELPAHVEDDPFADVDPQARTFAAGSNGAEERSADLAQKAVADKEESRRVSAALKELDDSFAAQPEAAKRSGKYTFVDTETGETHTVVGEEAARKLVQEKSNVEADQRGTQGERVSEALRPASGDASGAEDASLAPAPVKAKGVDAKEGLKSFLKPKNRDIRRAELEAGMSGGPEPVAAARRSLKLQENKPEPIPQIAPKPLEASGPREIVPEVAAKELRTKADENKKLSFMKKAQARDEQRSELKKNRLEIQRLQKEANETLAEGDLVGHQKAVDELYAKGVDYTPPKSETSPQAPRPPSKPVSEDKEQAEGSVLPGWVPDSVAKALTAAINPIRDIASGNFAPRTREADRVAEAKLGVLAASHGAATHEARALYSEMGIKTDKEAHTVAAAIDEYNQRQITPAKGSTVFSHVGKGQFFKSEAEYKAALNSPVVKNAMKVLDNWNTDVRQPLYAKAQGKSAGDVATLRKTHLTPLHNSAEENATVDNRQKAVGKAVQANTNVGLRASGESESGHSTDLMKVLEHNVRQLLTPAATHDVVEHYLKAGLANETGENIVEKGAGPGDRDVTHSVSPVSFNYAENGLREPKTIFVRSDLQKDLVKALNVDGKTEAHGILKAISHVYTKGISFPISEGFAKRHPILGAGNLALSALSPEALAHGLGLVDRISGMPGRYKSALADASRIAGHNLAMALYDVGSIGHDVLKNDPKVLREYAEIAKIGAGRPVHSDGAQASATEHLDTSSRVALGRMWENLSARGVKGFEKGNINSKRDFINRLGNYNKPMQGAIVRALTSSGLQSFAVAASSNLRAGVHGYFGKVPGNESKKLQATEILRNVVSSRLAALAAVYMIWGDDKDKLAKAAANAAITLPKKSEDGSNLEISLDQHSGVARGNIGQNEALEGWMRGKPSQDVIDAASKRAVTRGKAIFEGPVADIIEAGFNAPTSKRAPGESKTWFTMKHIAKHGNPMWEGVFEENERAAKEGRDKGSFLERAGRAVKDSVVNAATSEKGFLVNRLLGVKAQKDPFGKPVRKKK